MATLTRPRVAGLTIASLASAALLGVSAPTSAFAQEPAKDKVTATFVKLGPGLDGVLPYEGERRPAGSIILKLSDGTNLETFCLEFAEKTAESSTYTADGWENAPVSKEVLSKVTYLAKSHDKIGKAADTADYENAATQVAIWKLTDPKKVNVSKIGNDEFEKRVAALVAAAEKATPAAEPVLSYDIEGSKSVLGKGEDKKTVVAGKLTDATGAPVAGADVTFVVDGEETVVQTDKQGVASIELPDTDIERTISMLYSAAVPAGTVIQPAQETRQSVIAAEGFTVDTEESLTVAAAEPEPKPDPKPEPKPEPKPDPKPEPKPQPKPQPEPKAPVVSVPQALPETGDEGMGAGTWAALLAGIAAVAGGGAASVRRFRR